MSTYQNKYEELYDIIKLNNNTNYDKIYQNLLCSDVNHVIHTYLNITNNPIELIIRNFSKSIYLEKILQFIKNNNHNVYINLNHFLKIFTSLNDEILIMIFNLSKKILNNLDYHLYYDLPEYFYQHIITNFKETEYLKDIFNFNNDIINNYKKNNIEINKFQEDLLELGYSTNILNFEGNIFNNDVNVFNNSNILLKDKYDLKDFELKYGSIVFKEEKCIQKLSLNIVRSYNNIKNKCNNKYDGCYKDTNRKRLFQIAYTNNGFIIEALLDNINYGSIEVLYSKKGLIIFQPYYNENYKISIDNYNLLEICIKSLSKLTDKNIYVIDNNIELPIIKKDILIINQDLLQLSNIKLYYDIPNDITIYLIDSKHNNILNSIIIKNDTINNMKKNITNLLLLSDFPKKYLKSIILYIDEFIKNEIDPFTYMNNKYNTCLINKNILKEILLNIFEIKFINKNDKLILEQINELELEYFGNNVFNINNIEGFVLWSHIHNKIFGYLITEQKNKNGNIKLIIHSALVIKSFRHYGLILELYKHACIYYNKLNIKLYTFYLEYTDKTDNIVNMFCNILNKNTNLNYKYKLIKLINYEDGYVDSKYSIFS